MPSRTRALALLAQVAAAVLVTVAPPVRPAAAQSFRDDRDQMERREIRAVDFGGVKSVKLSDLKESLMTQPSACSGLLYTPFCLVSKSPYFYERHYFDELEFRRDVLRILVFYYRRGWRDARVDTVVTRTPDEIRIRFDVTEGAPTLVDTVVVAGLPQGVRRPRRSGAGRRNMLSPGEPLNTIKLDSLVVRIRESLLDRGYGNAVVEAPRIDEDSAARRARVTIATRPGPLTPIARIDVVRLTGDSTVSDETIRNSLTVKPGDLLRRRRVAESQRALYESGLFRSALIDTAVTTDAANGRTICAQQGSGSPPSQLTARAATDSTKNLVVCVIGGQLHDARVGVGFTTADFVAVQGAYNDNYWLGGPRRLSITGTVGNLGARQLNGRAPFFDIFSSIPENQQDDRFYRPTYQAGADVRWRWLGSPRNTFGTGIFASRRSSPGVFIDRSYGANAAFTRTLTPQLPVSATYRFELNRVEAGDIYFCVNFGVCDFQTIDALSGRQSLSPFALSSSVATTDDPLEPTTGYTGRLGFEHASKVTLSDYRYNRASADGATYFRLPFRRAILAVHAQIGYVRALGSTNAAVGVAGGGAVLHPSKRFYAGGSQSVRGFGENQLGPRVLTVDPNAIRGRDSDDATATCPATTASTLAACFAQRGDSITDENFAERPLGGTAVVAGNLEVRVPIAGPLIGAIFLDGALLGERSLGDFTNSTGAITPGFGVRYLSPVGPIRVDVGFRPKLQEALPVLTQVTDASGVRRLVDLTGGRGCTGSSTAADGCRLFPLRESDKAISRFLNRLTLHLSIGEAF